MTVEPVALKRFEDQVYVHPRTVDLMKQTLSDTFKAAAGNPDPLSIDNIFTSKPAALDI